MRLLIVDEEIIAGGIDTLRRHLVPALARLVDRIVWVAPGHAVDRFHGIAGSCENVMVETLDSRKGLGRVLEGMGRRAGAGFQRQLTNRRLRKLARLHRCDVSLTTCVFGQQVPEVGVPVAGIVSDVNPALPGRIIDNIAMWVETTAMTIAVSDFTCSELKRMKPHRAERIQSVPLAGPIHAPKSNGVSVGRFYYPSAVHPHKGHLVLLDAAQRLAARGADFRLTLSGAGMDALAHVESGSGLIGEMRDLLQGQRFFGGRVSVAGDVCNKEVERLFAEASCIVIPSSYEGFGLPLAEAIAYGKRVICSEIPPFREQVERQGYHRNVTFVLPGDVAALECAMESEIHAARKHGEACNAQARWGWAEAAERCRDLLEGLAGHG